MLSGNKDSDLLILQYLDDGDLFNICSVSKYIAGLCRNRDLWIKKLSKKFYVDWKNQKHGYGDPRGLSPDEPSLLFCLFV